MALQGGALRGRQLPASESEGPAGDRRSRRRPRSQPSRAEEILQGAARLSPGATSRCPIGCHRRCRTDAPSRSRPCSSRRSRRRPPQARTPPPKLTGLRCVPATRAVCHPRPQVMIGKQVQLRGHGVQGRDARELSLVEGGAGDEAQALADGVGGPCPARDQGRDDLGARHRPRRAPIARDPARRAAGARAAPGAQPARCRRRSPATGCGSGSCRRARAATSTPSRRGRGRPASRPCSSRARTARTMRGRSSTRRWSRPCTRMASTCARGSSSTAPIRSARRRRARAPWRRAPTASSSTPRAATRAATRRRSSTSPRCGPPSGPRIRSG